MLFREDKNIVYGYTSYVDNMQSGQESPFELSDYNIPDHDSYEVSAFNLGEPE